jgi:hypothetical protein
MWFLASIRLSSFGSCDANTNDVGDDDGDEPQTKTSNVLHISYGIIRRMDGIKISKDKWSYPPQTMGPCPVVLCLKGDGMVKNPNI